MQRSVWRRAGLWLRSLGVRLRSFVAAADPIVPAISPSGTLDVRSIDLGDRTGWIQRGDTYTRFDEIQSAIVSDALLLRAAFIPQQLARQGEVTLEPASGKQLSNKKAELALQEVEVFLSSVRSVFNEGYEELFVLSVGELGRFSNFALELIWKGSELVNLEMLPWLGMNLQVDKQGIPSHWIQFDFYMKRHPFELWKICHGVLNRQAGDRYGTPGLGATAGDNGDLQAYRAVEAMAGQQLQHLIFPTRIIKFGTEKFPETSGDRLSTQKDRVESMYREGYLIGSGRESLESDAPDPMDTAPLLQYWKKRVAQATGYSLTRLGEADGVPVATAEVLAAGENQHQLAIALAASAAWRDGVFVPLLAAKGIPAKYAPYLVPGEPDPVRRQKNSKHAAEQFGNGIITQDEARIEDGRQPMTDEQRQQQPPPKKSPDKEETPPSEPEEVREKRQEERTK